jgi:hypothetical protein
MKTRMAGLYNKPGHDGVPDAAIAMDMIARSICSAVDHIK